MTEETRSWDQIVGIPIKPMWSRDSHLCIQKTVTKLSPSHPMQLQNDLKSSFRSEYFEDSLQVPIFLEFNNCVVKVSTPASPLRYFSLVLKVKVIS